MHQPSPSIDHKSHPYARSWWFSRLHHSWLSTVLRQSRKRHLQSNDLYDLLPEYESHRLIDTFEMTWQREVQQHSSKASLFRVIVAIFGKSITLNFFVLAVFEFTRIGQPLLLARFLSYFQPCSKMSSLEVYLLAGGICFISWFGVSLRHFFFDESTKLAMKVRISLSGLLFRKILRLHTNSFVSVSSGKIINLLTNDVARIDGFIDMIYWLVCGPLEAIVVIWLLWQRIGSIVLVAIVFTVIFITLQMVLAQITEKIWSFKIHQSDQRIKLMNEIVRSIRLIKMCVWEKSFQHKVEQVRRQEVRQLIWRSAVDALRNASGQTFISILFLQIYGLLGWNNISFKSDLFTVAFVLLQVLRFSLLWAFPEAFLCLQQYHISTRRILEFLNMEEQIVNLEEDRLNEAEPFIDLLNVSARWNETNLFQLSNLSFTARAGSLVAIVGPVGAGKSSLLHILLHEMTLTSGRLRVHGRSSYVPQQSWIFSSTIRQNILFGLPYEKEKFLRVLQVTALQQDLEKFPHGEWTLVGDNGVVLSGGQRARINLARALYRESDVYLLDDPLSAVDTRTSKALFKNCIRGMLKSKVCILVTHHLHFLRNVNCNILCMDQGTIVAQGTFTSLFQTNAFFRRLVNDIQRQASETDENRWMNGNESSVRDSLTENSQWSEEQQLPQQANDEQDRENANDDEEHSTGAISARLFVKYFRAGTGYLGIVLLLLLFACTAALVLISDWWLSKWNEEESIRQGISSPINCTELVRNISDNDWQQRRDRYFYVYLLLSLSALLALVLRILLFSIGCLIAARVTHNRMFKRLLHARVHFFDMNPVGRIINRFAKDTENMDERLPSGLMDFFDAAFSTLATFIFINVLNPWTLIPTGIMFVLLFYLRHCYLRASIDCQRLESSARSPIYSHLSSTLAGIPVIRAFQAHTQCARDYETYLDKHTKAYYLLLTIDRWSGIRFDWMSAGFITFLIVCSLLLHTRLSTANITVTLVYALSLIGLFQWMIRIGVDVMLQMISVERVSEYCQLPLEEADQTKREFGKPPAPWWPLQGNIVFDALSFRYSPHSPWILRDISINIAAGEKIGIVGRTGAGKSSIIQSLFRMADLDGRILIDNVDTNQIALQHLRRRISIIPQDPILFHDTLRHNIDPFGDYSDTELWRALDEVQLKPVISQLPHGFEHVITEGGSNFSVGQRQLICLARALLRKNKIFVIDEATANVDMRTDGLIQQAIRSKLKDCTVLTIAHRLRTIIDNDKILVLADGRVIDFDHPHVLLSNSNSFFSQMVTKTSKNERRYLILQAKKYFDRRNNFLF